MTILIVCSYSIYIYIYIYELKYSEFSKHGLGVFFLMFIFTVSFNGILLSVPPSGSGNDNNNNSIKRK